MVVAACIVTKTDGTARFCVEYRKLNAVTIADCHPLPNIEQLSTALRSAEFFTTFDIASCYWQIELTETAEQKTEFFGPAGLLKLNRMPFGLNNAPSVFNPSMNVVLAGLN